MTDRITNRKEMEQFLNELPTFSELGASAAHLELQRIRSFCGELGQPQKAFPTVHVAGTNGKGSVCRYIASIYTAAGYDTGVLVSPHLQRFNERFTINGNEISDEELIRFFNTYRDLILDHDLTYFEITVALAFWWFSTEKVDLAVIETGLGGKLDATNIVTPEVSVITNIGRDHMPLLGTSLQEVAEEKAGIIKPGTPVVAGNVDPDSFEVIRSKAERMGAPVYTIEEFEPRYENGHYFIAVEGREINVPSDLQAPVNLYNIAMAIQVVKCLNGRFPIRHDQYIEGIGAVENLYPRTGNFELLDPDLNWYFDGAHNREAFASLFESLETIHPLSDWVVVLSMMQDKLNSKLLKQFSDFKKKYYYALEADRAASYEQVSEYMDDALPLSVNSDGTTIDRRLRELSSELVIFTGSFYFYDTVRRWVNSIDKDN